MAESQMALYSQCNISILGHEMHPNCANCVQNETIYIQSLDVYLHLMYYLFVEIVLLKFK